MRQQVAQGWDRLQELTAGFSDLSLEGTGEMAAFK